MPLTGQTMQALLAIQMLAIEDQALADKLSAMKTQMEQEVMDKNQKIQAEVEAL